MNQKFLIVFSIILILGFGTVVASGDIVNLNLFSKAQPVISADSYVEVMKGNVPGHSIVNKFGRNPSIGTSLSFVSISGQYQTPLTSQNLEILSSSALDTLAGTGGRSVVVIGLDGDFNEINETVNLNGVTPVQLSKKFIRVFRMYVASSGTYATTTTSSHVGTITLRNTGAGVIWSRITVADGIGIGQSQIGGYTIPAGKTAYLLSKHISIESNKPSSIYFFKRENADDNVTGYTGTMRLFEENDGITEQFVVKPHAPLNKFPEKTDVGYFAKVTSTTASISVEFQLLLVDN